MNKNYKKTTQEIFRIDEVIFRDKKRALVKWKGYPDNLTLGFR